MKFIRARAWDLLSDDDGTSAVEYAIMLALIITVCLGTVTTLGINTKIVCEVVCDVLVKAP